MEVYRKLKMSDTNLEEYQDFTDTLAVYPREQNQEVIISAMYCALGLTGEAGEVAEKIKKWHRDGEINLQDLSKEIGDVLWYLTALSSAVGLDIQSCLEINMNKLRSRQARGVLKGNGDNR